MARILTTGFELQSLTAGVEFKANGSGGGVTIDTTTKRTGSASLKCTSAAAFNWMSFQTKTAASATRQILRVYMNFSSLPGSGTAELFSIADTTGVVQSAYIRYNSTGTKLECLNDTGTNYGGSATVTTGVWYRIELDVTAGIGVGVVNAYLDGTNFATSTTASINNFDGLYLGNAFNADTITCFYDDIAVNDTSGSFQNTLPGAGQVVHLYPSAAGDNNAFTVQIGGTAGAANNFTRVKEITPDDVTTYNGDVTSGQIDDFNIDDTPSSIASTDTINVVHVGVRYRALVAAAEAAFQVRTKKASAGTVNSSTAITPNATAWKTNANAEPRLYPTTLYQDPDSSNWTKATLDTAQIGYNISTTNTNAADISTVWMVVDSTPASGTATVVPMSTLAFLGA